MINSLTPGGAPVTSADKDSFSSGLSFSSKTLAFMTYDPAADTACCMSVVPSLSKGQTHLARMLPSQWETGKRLLNEVSYCVTVKSSCWPGSPQQRSPSVMVITSHLAPSWVAEWFYRVGAPPFSDGPFYKSSVSSIRLRVSHEGH